MKRKKTKKVKIGGIEIGGGAPVAVQSMTNTPTKNAAAAIGQIKKLEKAGCEIIRVSIPDIKSAAALKKIKKAVKIPVVADIHYDYRLALISMDNGADKIRINPGNIGSREKVKEIISAAKANGAAVRIGVNAGSVKKNIGSKFRIPGKNKTVIYMLRNLLEHVEFFEKNRFRNIVVSLKASDVPATVEAYKLFSKYRDYPLHIGITEAGTEVSGAIKSSAGLGILLYEGLGDTIRVSLSADPVKEVFTAYKILDCLGLRKRGVEIISCPTCARTEINVIETAKKLEKELVDVEKPVKVAVMGCGVNGPGEAKHADIGVTGSGKYGIIFRKGRIVKKIDKKNLIAGFKKELNKLLKDKNRKKR